MLAHGVLANPALRLRDHRGLAIRWSSASKRTSGACGRISVRRGASRRRRRLRPNVRPRLSPPRTDTRATRRPPFSMSRAGTRFALRLAVPRADHVQLGGIHPDQVPPRVCTDPAISSIGQDFASTLRSPAGLPAPSPAARRPTGLDQLIGRHDPAGIHQQSREEYPLLPAAMSTDIPSRHTINGPSRLNSTSATTTQPRSRRAKPLVGSPCATPIIGQHGTPNQ